jgi:hydroxymethylpyrimidine pyrophosphatase-like HAD family hydrolase
VKEQAADAAGGRTLYVSDLDGTLLRSDASVSPRSVRLINDAIDRGVLFTYATARSFSSSRRVTSALRLELPLVTYGGTVTAHPVTGAASDVQLLPRATVEAALAVCASVGLQPILHTLEGGRDWLRWWPGTVTPGTRVFIDLRAGDPRLRPVTDADPVDLAAVFYVAVLADRAALLALRDILLPALDGCAHFLSEDPATLGFDWLEFHTWEGTKSAALRRLMAAVGADRLVAFGNNHNDLPMFEIADESYAVAGSVPEALAAATGVIGSNDDDAVALWLDARTTHGA